MLPKVRGLFFIVPFYIFISILQIYFYIQYVINMSTHWRISDKHASFTETIRDQSRFVRLEVSFPCHWGEKKRGRIIRVFRFRLNRTQMLTWLQSDPKCGPGRTQLSISTKKIAPYQGFSGRVLLETRKLEAHWHHYALFHGILSSLASVEAR